ncbi:hypothetical protein PZ895_08000 [Mesorhizobium sp. YIM 152430]|uniref:DnaT-like ssDNA-binding protein n=1 Tax=Mesorhizobium sp. YIM 152430 TaxID=3031761 RepID=UPI0023DC49E7|nr:DnaT-like ssDNA-binding protein [Mesorhizobium sp. YIM 152430]MDF1599718.1 hypothetical protein [Mesorhizobium sp. YIM 152430]
MTPYGTEAGFTEYAAAMGYTVPTGDVLPAIVRGSVYVDGVYGERFTGVQADMMQERAWPRIGATAFGTSIAPSITPKRVEHAAYEAALAELRAPGSLSIVVTPSKRIVEVKAGSAGVRYSDQGDAIDGAIPVLTVVEGLLAPLLTQPMPSIMVV